MDRTLKLLMLSDIFVITGFGLMTPILAIFIKDNLIGGTIFAAGLASTLFLITKSLIQIPFSKYVDNHDERIKWLIVGTFLISIIPFFYLAAKSVYWVYVAQVIYGVGSGLAYPTWISLWSTHLSKKHESFEWSVYSTMTGIGTAIAASLGAVIAEYVGFDVTFILVGLLSLFGCGILFDLGVRKPKMEKTSLVCDYETKGFIQKRSH